MFGACKVEGCDCKKYRLKTMQSKYHAKIQEFKGVKYDSGLEARIAADLEYQRVAGDIVEVKRQFCIDFVINGYKITRHYVDFRVTYKDGTVELIEAKGMDTPMWIVKRRLVEAIYLVDNPGVKYRVLR